MKQLDQIYIVNGPERQALNSGSLTPGLHRTGTGYSVSWVMKASGVLTALL